MTGTSTPSGHVATSGAEIYIGSFALKVPGRDSAPIKQKRKAAFDKAPSKKQLPKLSFSSANNNKKPNESQDVEAPEVAAQNKDGKLQQWLRSGNGDRPGMEEAREYLLRGTPYRGQHAFTSKDAIKELGAVWVKNPLKKDEARDGISFGWFCAQTDGVLIDLIRMPHVARASRNSRTDQVPQWSPIDVPVESHELVVRLIMEFQAHERERFVMETKAANEARDAKKAAERSALFNTGIPENTQGDIDQLRDDWGVVWTEAMEAAASRCPGLGPHSGISPARRAVRGLLFKVCTANEVINGEYQSDVLQTNRDFHNGIETLGGVESMTNVVDYTKVPVLNAMSGMYMFGKGRGMLEWPQEITSCHSNATAKTISVTGDAQQTFCTGCTSEIVQQFGGCSCDGLESWEWCNECHTAFHAEQACRCAHSGGPRSWDVEQEKCKAESSRRSEKAERDLHMTSFEDDLQPVEHANDDEVDNRLVTKDTSGSNYEETLTDFWGTR